MSRKLITFSETMRKENGKIIWKSAEESANEWLDGFVEGKYAKIINISFAEGNREDGLPYTKILIDYQSLGA